MHVWRRGLSWPILDDDARDGLAGDVRQGHRVELTGKLLAGGLAFDDH